MNTMIRNGSQYDWATWMMGMWRAVVGGGAGFIVGDHSTVMATFRAMGESFLIVGAVHMFIFLQTHPGPDRIVVTTTETATRTDTLVTKVDTKMEPRAAAAVDTKMDTKTTPNGGV
jgi:hypothetical protein